MTRLLLPSGIYTITNIANGHRYVGSAVDIDRRWRDHKTRLLAGTHRNDHLQKAYNKHGKDAFEFKVLEYCPRKPHLISTEQKWMDKLNPEYNICQVAGSSLGYKHTAEYKAKLTGRKLSAEHKAKLSRASMGNTSALGNKLSADTRAKMSARMMGNKLSAETRAKLSVAMAGNTNSVNGPGFTGKHTAEARAKMSAAKMGNTNALGYKHTAESRAKISVAQKGKPWSALRRARYEARKRND